MQGQGCYQAFLDWVKTLSACSISVPWDKQTCLCHPLNCHHFSEGTWDLQAYLFGLSFLYLYSYHDLSREFSRLHLPMCTNSLLLLSGVQHYFTMIFKARPRSVLFRMLKL